jgi:hypothetical protein
MSDLLSRRRFLSVAPLALVGMALSSRRASAPIVRVEHPDPRPGITAEGVRTREALIEAGADERVLGIFDMVREMPQIADGIDCYCGCALRPGYRSLLTCYHEGGMAIGCPICQGEATLAYRRWKQGQPLERIRRAIDARYA